MILSQLRREWASWTLRWWLPVAGILGLWIFAMCLHTRSEIGPVPFGAMTSGSAVVLFITWFLLSIALLAAGANQRCSGLLDLALPLAPRRLWIGHMAAVVLPVIAVPAVALCVVAAGNGLGGIRPLVQPGLLSFALHLTAAFVLALALLQSPNPTLFRIRYTRGYVLLTILSIGGVLGLVLSLSTVSPIFALAPLGAGLLLFVRIYFLLPASFSLVPLELDRGDAAASGSAAAGVHDDAHDRAQGGVPPAGRGSFRLLHSTIWRSAIGNWTWLFPIAFGFHGFVLSMSFTVDEGRGSAFVYLFFTWSILACWLLVANRRLFVLDALPISRHRIFAVFVGTALFCVAAGYGLGVGLGVATGDFPPRVEVGLSDCCCIIQIPHEYREISWDGAIPPSIAPWGEEVRPEGISLFKGGRACSYSPFALAPDSSADFVAWQLGRALERIHGETIAFETIRKRCLDVGPEGRTILNEGGLSLLANGGRFDSTAGTRTIPVVLLVIGLWWMLFAALTYRAMSGGRCGTVWLIGAMGGFVAVLVVGVGGLAAEGLGLVDLVAFSDFFSVLVRTLHEALPGGAVTVWAGTLLLLAGGYLLAGREFASVEAPVDRAAKV